ncbi:MAG: flagellar hook-basal body complex protein [Oscillospiraceae bacterium]|nr:flagellar hook-basal body complex protein [Oscillospiraceae bacterium]
MIRSMFSAVTGLKSHQTMMDVIGNNIANVNTAGFKSSRVLFNDLYYQTLSSASKPSAGMGGVNPSQIGYGAAVGSVQVLNTRSGYKQTSRALDMYISGEGYFTTSDTTGNMNYTRVGALEFDTEGNLLDSNNNYIMGITAGSIPPYTAASLQKIKINNFSNYNEISISADGTLTGMNTQTSTIDVLGQLAIAVFNNPDGLSQEGSQYFRQTGNSGVPTYTTAGGKLAGPLISGGLEMSNVDLSNEFTDMIVAQRGFQANSRVITTSDQILEELVNLKR